MTHAADERARRASALASKAAEGNSAAREDLEQLGQAYANDANVRHALGRVHEALGNPKTMTQHFLEVLRLDTEEDEIAGFELEQCSGEIIEMARRVVEGLPTDFRERLARVPIVVEARPSLDLVEQGFDPRSVGLFEGPDHREAIWETPQLVPRIVLYAANLTAWLGPNQQPALEREVEITVLHEIGHYFGLDEEQLQALGLQ